MLREYSGNHDLITNEEKRVEVYTEGDAPTDPGSVNGRTRIENLNLNWREKELPERQRTKHVHRLHPYLGKFIPQLVEVFLRKYFKPGQVVFDPFSGSGTTLVQAKEMGIDSVGCDISAFNVLLTRAKTKSYSAVRVKDEILDILESVRNSINPEAAQPELALLPNRTDPAPSHDSDYLRNWYAPEALNELLTYRNLIPNYKDQEILKVILSRSARSARLTTHFDLDFPKKPQIGPYYCYKHSRYCQPTKTAYQFLRRYSLDTIRRIEQYSAVSTEAKVKVIHGDSRRANPGPVDGVITSPPYVGLINYHEQHRYAYELLGIEDLSEHEIGAARKGSSRKAQREYQQLLVDVFSNCLRHMNGGGRLIVIAGDRHNLYPEIAEACNLKVESVIKRHVNRRTGRRSGEFYESIFIWRKR